jgi:hypothetical protein
MTLLWLWLGGARALVPHLYRQAATWKRIPLLALPLLLCWVGVKPTSTRGALVVMPLNSLEIPIYVIASISSYLPFRIHRQTEQPAFRLHLLQHHLHTFYCRQCVRSM